MRVLVTGGAGFIGSHTVDKLVESGNEVIIVDNLSTGQIEFVNPEAELIKMDICDDKILQLFAERKFDAVMHCAAQIDVRKSVMDPVADASTNILGSLNILQSAFKTHVKRVVFSSTGGAIYGDTDQRPTPVGAECKPISPYGITKLSIEHYLYYYSEIHGMNSFVTRYANVYGPRQNPHGEAGVVAIFCERMLRNEPLKINGDGKQTRDYVFVDDVARANLLALNETKSGIANIGTSVEVDVNEIFHLINDSLEAGREETHGPAMPGEQKTSCLDISATKKLLGWEPRVTVADGIRQTALWFKERHEA
jgi:UDP-glucose 4-epimerase